MKECFNTYLGAANASLRASLKECLEHEELQRHYPHEINEALEAIRSGPIAAIEWLTEPRLPRFELDSSDDPERADILLGLVEILHEPEFLQAVVAVDSSELSALKLFRASVRSEEASLHGPRLIFPALETWAKFRHRSLIMLARLGDPEPLRLSLDEPWKVQSADIAHHRRLAWALLDAVSPSRSTPTASWHDDEVWKDVLDVLAFHSVEELKENLRNRSSWKSPANSEMAYDRRAIHILGIEAAPAEQRWSLLAPFASELWNCRHDGALSDFWELVYQLVEERDGDDTWSEPLELRRKRIEWAERHDPETIENWCDRLFNVSMLLDDLDGFGERAWPYLDADQRRILLVSLPKGDVEEPWWSRRHELNLKAQLDVARRHGPMSERRRVARQILQAQHPEPEQRLRTWLALIEAERPPRKVIIDDIREFKANLRKGRLSLSQARLCSRLLVAMQTPDDVVEWLPHVIEPILRNEFASSAEEDGATSNHVPRSVRRLVRELRDAIQLMRSIQLRDLIGGIERLGNRVYKTVAKKADVDDSMLRGRISNAVKGTAELVESMAAKSKWSPIETYAEAEGELKALLKRDAEELGYSHVEHLFENLSSGDREKLMKETLNHPKLLKISGALGTLILGIDGSSMSTSDALKTVERLCDITQLQLQDMSDPKSRAQRQRDLVAGFLDVVPLLERTILRKEVQRRAGEFKQTF